MIWILLGIIAVLWLWSGWSRENKKRLKAEFEVKRLQCILKNVAKNYSLKSEAEIEGLLFFTEMKVQEGWEND